MKIRRSGTRSMKIIAIIMIVVCLVTTCICLILASISDKYTSSKLEFDEIAKVYYEQYLYPEFIKEHSSESLESAFADYAKPGFPTVRLRQILNYYTIMRGEDIRSYFETTNYKCDTNSSTIDYLPYSPYGPNDVKIEKNLSCKDK